MDYTQEGQSQQVQQQQNSNQMIFQRPNSLSSRGNKVGQYRRKIIDKINVIKTTHQHLQFVQN
jgi:hypothetical protein